MTFLVLVLPLGLGIGALLEANWARKHGRLTRAKVMNVIGVFLIGGIILLALFSMFFFIG
jgi:hypothetical protein